MRNPFLMRASESITSETIFLRLFGTEVLNHLDNIELWNRVQIIRSAPGGGKTSLLRLFTPDCLLRLHQNKESKDYKPLYKKLNELGVLDEVGPKVLGVYLSCMRNYASLEDLGLDELKTKRLFFSLLNARVVLAALREIQKLKELKELDQISINIPSDFSFVKYMPPYPVSGKLLFEWARKIEEEICKALDSLEPASHQELPGHEEIFAPQIFLPENIHINGQKSPEKLIFMFDDLHKLTARQRKQLLELIDRRLPTGIWLAERYEVLGTDELLTGGATAGRDYKIIDLSRIWKKTSSLMDVANRRVHLASDNINIQFVSYEGCLKDKLDNDFEEKINEALKTVADRVKSLAGKQNRYREWVEVCKNYSGTNLDKVISWQKLQILIERDKRKEQLSFDFPLSDEELEKKDESEVRAAAELFVSKEFDFPYYYGKEKLASLSSANIEQFLNLAGLEFEEILSLKLIKEPTALLPAKRQHEIVKKAARKKWEDIPRQVPEGRDVKSLLDAIGRFSNDQTYRPNAPYAPGVTGIAISLKDREMLRDRTFLKQNVFYQRLARALASAIANNLLEMREQRCKNNDWMVLYLNRLLCAYFDLPLQYGGFREQSLSTLSSWLAQGYKSPKREQRLFA